MQILISYILNKYENMPEETQKLNKSIAYFLKVLFENYYNF